MTKAELEEASDEGRARGGQRRRPSRRRLLDEGLRRRSDQRRLLNKGPRQRPSWRRLLDEDPRQRSSCKRLLNDGPRRSLGTKVSGGGLMIVLYKGFMEKAP